MIALEQPGCENRCSLGDRDLALQVERTRRLRVGETLSAAVMGDLPRRLSLRAELPPVTGLPVCTMVPHSERRTAVLALLRQAALRARRLRHIRLGRD
ncbi:MAG: hypothetical protein KJZ83_22790 [Burkholderiaceae bacterium]|nr:hypothetical protein [Burkholderiaceae bacterium]